MPQGVTLSTTDAVATIRINQADRPVNVLSPDLIQEMEEVIRQLETSRDIKAAVIISGKPDVWIAGADIEEFTKIESAADGEAMSRSGHDLLGRLERLRIPVIAAIDGVALGGGLELALACTYRIATDSPKTKLGLPEVQLGIVPGAGGTQRLPRLVGLRASLDLMLTGKQLDGRRARKIGLVDEVVPQAVLLSAAQRAGAELASGARSAREGRRKGSPQWMENLPGVRGFIIKKAREGVMEKTRGLYPAPLRIIDVVDKGIELPLEEGLDLEARAFGELSVTPESRSLVHLFFATTAAKSKPGLDSDAEAREINRMAVVGAGFMGAAIAAVSAEKGIRVRLKDVTPEAAARGLGTARASLIKRARKRKKPDHEITQLTDRVEATFEYTGFRSTDLVVEAVFEDVDLKHRVIKEIEEASGDDTVLGSNTSTIPIARLAEAAGRPANLIGMHFFSPVEKMPLLELIITPETAPGVIATSHSFGKRIGKTPIIVNDAPGFYVNRILGPYMNEAALLLQEGVAMEAIDEAMLDWGFPVGPITLYDEVGIDVAAKSGKILTEAFGDRMTPNEVIPRMTGDERLGRKNARGFYKYEDGKNRKATGHAQHAKKAGPDEEVYSLIGAAERKTMPPGEIQDRLSLGMLNEAVRCLEEEVLRSARDGDVGAVLGIGFPPFRGGPFWHINQLGAKVIVSRLQHLASVHGPRFAPAPLLVKMGENGDNFEF